MDAPDYPTPPNPKVVAEAQTASNKETAIANAHLNRFDQNSPFGSVKYAITGTNADGTPRYQQDTTLSAPMQGIFDNHVGMTQGIGDIGQQQLGQLQKTIGGGFDVNAETEGRINSLIAARLNPELQRQDEGLRNRLSNQGIMEGTVSFDRAMERQGRTANDARNQMMLNGRQQAMNEAVTNYQLPFNTFNAIRNGSQVGMPQQSQFAPVNQAGTNVAGIYSDGFNQQMQIANAENASNNAFMGGISSMLGQVAGAGLRYSDARLKRNVSDYGVLPSGLPVYRYQYCWSDEPQVGVMAHEARELFPDAVREIGGFLAVDYSRIG